MKLKKDISNILLSNKEHAENTSILVSFKLSVLKKDIKQSISKYPEMIEKSKCFY
jgi:hypothetical protein